MAPLNCCSFRRPVSPELQPAVLIDTSQTGGRFALSSHTPSPVGSRENVITNSQPIHKILTLATKNDIAQEASAASGNDISSACGTEPDIGRRDSNRRLHEVASKIGRRMSRDSGISKRKSKTTLGSSLSEDDYQRRGELKRALHQRVQEDIDEGSNISDGSFDEDAVPIKTPRGTWGRHEGSIQISPKHLSNALRRSDSPSAYADLELGTLSQVPATKNPAVALSRMLVRRGSSLAKDSEEQAVDSKAEVTQRASSTQKYKFSDEDSPVRVPKTRSYSPLGRSNTVLHMPSPSKALEIDMTNPAFLNTAGTSSSIDPLPIRLNKVRHSAAGGDSRLSVADIRQGVSPNEANETHRSSLDSAMFAGVYDTKIRPASEQLRHGASGLWRHPVRSTHSNTHSTNDTHTSSSNGHRCNPGSEEMSFGGTDGKDYSPSASETYHQFPIRERGCSDGNGPVHLYNMHIPQRLASKFLLPSVSLPQLEHPRRHRSYTSGSSSRWFSVVPRSQPSSSASTNDRQYRTPASHFTSSSVYSSGSLSTTLADSIQRLNSVSDRLYYLEVSQPSKEIISVPASRPNSVNIDKLERHTAETSYHSSNESLMNRELAAAETRISPLRASTLPKNSRFKEDLDRISAELALTNPPRRRFSNLDGARSPTHEDVTSIWEKALREHSQEDRAISHTRIGSTAVDSVGSRQLDSKTPASNRQDASSLWEKALREHSQEDRAISHTRMGSTFPDYVSTGELDPKTAASTEPKARKRSTFLRPNDRRVPERLEGAQLQAHLSAYTLPTKREKISKRPTLEGIRGSPSKTRALSWARYPSHTRPERSTSPAGASDLVYSRDFAITPPPQSSSEQASAPPSSGKKGKTKTMTFGKQMLSTISSLYKSQSLDLQRRLANEARGHRSSISEGGAVEYPELEMLGSISPPMPSPDIKTKLQLEEHVRRASVPQMDGAQSRTQSGQASRKQSQEWAKEYIRDCCLQHPGQRWQYRRPVQRSNSRDEDDAWREPIKESKSMGAIGGRKERNGGGEGDEGIRGSTLDFKRSLELDEWRARERIRLLGKG